jgi:pentatricopeptide repeat protein
MLTVSLSPTATQITFNTAISALGKGGQMGMALQLLNEMKSHGVLPDRISFNSAMSACARAASPRNDAYRRCLSLKQSMHRMGIRPDKFTYSSAISACAKAHQTSEALSLLEVMQASGEIPDVVTYTSTIDA